MKKLKLITGRVVDIISETFDTVTIQLKANEKDYGPGQFLTINPAQFNELASIVTYLKKLKKKQENSRAYSIGSTRLDKNILLTIKINDFCFIKNKYLPVLSPFLTCNFSKNRILQFHGYSGTYVIEKKITKQIDGIFYITAGSGIVPNFSLLNDCLNKKLTINFHILININKALSDVIYQNELTYMAKQHCKVLKIIYFLTQEKRSNYFYGKPNFHFIYSLLINKIGSIAVYACGPSNNKWSKLAAFQINVCLKNKFTEAIIFFVKKIGLTKKQFKYESYD